MGEGADVLIVTFFVKIWQHELCFRRDMSRLQWMEGASYMLLQLFFFFLTQLYFKWFISLEINLEYYNQLQCELLPYFELHLSNLFNPSIGNLLFRDLICT